jgi:hypothetical protein
MLSGLPVLLRFAVHVNMDLEAHWKGRTNTNPGAVDVNAAPGSSGTVKSSPLYRMLLQLFARMSVHIAVTDCFMS